MASPALDPGPQASASAPSTHGTRWPPPGEPVAGKPGTSGTETASTRGSSPAPSAGCQPGLVCSTPSLAAHAGGDGAFGPSDIRGRQQGASDASAAGTSGAFPGPASRGRYFSRERWLPLITSCLERMAGVNTERLSDFHAPGPTESSTAHPAPPAVPVAPAAALQALRPGDSVFHGPREAPLSVADYLDRLYTYFQCNPAALFAALCYIRRASLSDPYLQVTPLTVHRLLLAALTVGAKFLDDRFLSNAYYARVGGVTLRELNAMEAELLRRLGWRATVREEDVLQIMAILEMDGSLTDNPFGVGSGSDEEGRAAADAEAREL